MKQDYDILIVGAGMVGASLALALSTLPLRIALVEQAPLKSEVKSGGKPIALNYASISIFQTLKLWVDLASYANPIKTVHISQQGCFASTRMRAEEIGVSLLGGVIPAAQLAEVLTKNLVQLAKNKSSVKASFDLFNPAQCQALTKKEQGWEVLLAIKGTERQVIYPRLVVAADGSDSTVRRLLGIGIIMKSEGKKALVTTLTLAGHHHHIAYQRFIKDGIMACLPLLGNKVGLVWTADQNVINEIQALDEADFLLRLQGHFAYRLGKFLQRDRLSVYPLKSFMAQRQIQPGLVLLGNAAHTLSPIAAQGLNLALQDMAELVDNIAKALSAHKDLACPSITDAYLKARLPIQRRVIGFTEKLDALFQAQFGPLAFIRSQGLLALDLLLPCKKALSQRFMGIQGRLPNLTRGLTLKKECSS